MKVSRLRNRQRHHLVGIVRQRYTPAVGAVVMRPGLGFKLHTYQRKAFEEMLKRAANNANLQYPLHHTYPEFFAPVDPWMGAELREFQSRPRGLSPARIESLIIQPLSTRAGKSVVLALLQKKREAAGEFHVELDPSKLRSVPMHGDLSKGWSVVDEVPPFTNANKENNDGKAD